MPEVTVETGGRLHVGFLNLSLARERLYGGIGVGLERPTVRVRAAPAASVEVGDPTARSYARRAVEALSVDGVSLTVETALPRHVGLGSGTQLALAVLEAVGRAHGTDADVRAHAPALGRGGRSGVGVATYEAGGFVVDAGHPSDRFTSAPPSPGDWAVPPVLARHALPADWRFVVTIPALESGRSGPIEERSMRSIVERADPGIAEEIAAVTLDRLLPAAATGRLEAFGDAVSTIGRLNGAWYADVQGGIYRPPVGRIVSALADEPAVAGVGQSSWGPTVYAVTDAERVDEAVAAAETALAADGREGTVHSSPPGTGRSVR